MRTKFQHATLAAVLLLAACGQAGPLYLPDASPSPLPASSPAPTPSALPAAPVAAPSPNP